jgi:hypothetical protein
MRRTLLTSVGAAAVVAAIAGLFLLGGCKKDEPTDATKSAAPPPALGSKTAPAIAPRPKERD